MIELHAWEAGVTHDREGKFSGLAKREITLSFFGWTQSWSSLSQLSTDNETEEKMFYAQADLEVSHEAAAVTSAH